MADQSVNSSTSAANEKSGHTSKNLFHSVIKGALQVGLYTAVAPLERVNLLMQCQNQMIKAGRLSSPYKGMRDCLFRTVKHEGFFSLWRSNRVTVAVVCADQALEIALPQDPQKKTEIGMRPVEVMLATSIFHPIVYTQLRLSNDVKASGGLQFSLETLGKNLRNNGRKWQYRGAFDVLKKTLISDGFGGLYRGYTFSCIRWYAYINAKRNAEQLISTYSRKEKQNQNIHTMLTKIAPDFILCSSLSVALYPLDTVTNRMMMTSGGTSKYKGPLDAVCQIVRNEGVSSLYKGLIPLLINRVAMPSATIAALYVLAMFGINMSIEDLEYVNLRWVGLNRVNLCSIHFGPFLFEFGLAQLESAHFCG